MPPNPLKIKMVNYTEELNRRLLAMISSMEEEGIVEEWLGNVRNLKEVEVPYYFIELIPKFLSDSSNTLKEMEAALAKTDLDFSHMFQLNMGLKGSSSCFGASSMATACQKLSQAIDEKSKKGCIIGFDVLKNEYTTLHQKLDAIVELERS